MPVNDLKENSHSEKLNITDYCLRRNVQQFPNKTALILVDAIGVEQKWTYAALFKAVCQLTAGLRSLKLPKGSIVTIRTSNTLDLLLLFLSTMAADLVPITTVFSRKQEELEAVLRDAGSRLMFQLGSGKLPLQLPDNCRMVTDEEYQKLKSFQADDIAPTTLFADPAFIFYTSGSSGKPKGVLHAHHAILGRKPSLQYWLNLTERDVVMNTDNISWTYSMFTGFLDPLTVGATALIFTPSNQTSEAEDAISAETWLQLVEHYQISVIVSSPDIYNKIAQLEHPEKYDFSSLRLAGSAGAALPEEVEQRWQNAFHLPIYSALGMSELSTFINTGPTIPIKGESLGKIQPGRKVTILPLEGGFDPVPPHTIGMLAIHKTELGFMLGYVGKSPTDEKDYRGDWFLTQDLVSWDENGYLTYYGRADKVLKISGGFRVSPVEIEMAIKKCPDVIEVACGTVFDSTSETDLLTAYVVSEHPSQELAKQIYALVAEHLSDYKVPRFIYFVDRLPHNPRGKLMRSELHNLIPRLVSDRYGD